MARRPTLDTFAEDKWTLAGVKETGKTTFAIAWCKSFWPDKPNSYIWNLDGREQEYVQALGEGRVLCPDVPDPYNPIQVLEAIGADLNKGEFAQVGGLVMDPLTNIWNAVSRVGQAKKLAGSSEPTALEKANVMANTLSAVMRPRVPLLIIYHRHDAKGKNLQAESKVRDSISDAELERLDKALNMKLRTEFDQGRYGITIVHATRVAGWSPLTLWDETENYFEGMPQRIRNAVYRPDEHWSYDPAKYGGWLGVLNKERHLRAAEALALLQIQDWKLFPTGKEAMAAVRQAQESGSVTIPIVAPPPATAPAPIEDRPAIEPEIEDLDYGQEGGDD